MRRLRVILGIVALIPAICGTGSAQPVLAPATPAPLATPTPILRVIPIVPGSSSPAPLATRTPSGPILRFAGQLLDVEKGYAFFTTGDAFKLAPDARILDAATKAPFGNKPAARLYGSATFDATTGAIVELDVSRAFIASAQSFGTAAAHSEVARFSVAASPVTPNTDQHPNAYQGPPTTGRPVAVTFVVQVPPSTPLTDSVYISTDVSDWDPRAILMTRIDALHYRATTTFASGTVFKYKYTRGSFRTIEIGENGLNTPPRSFTVREADALRRDDVVYHWQDESIGIGTQNIGPDSIPTPFNPNAVLNRPTPPSAFVPAPIRTFPPGLGPAPPGGARGPG